MNSTMLTFMLWVILLLTTVCNSATAQTVFGTDTKTNSEQPDAAAAAKLRRGSITPERAWWDVLHYDLSVQVFPDAKRLTGSNKITFRIAPKVQAHRQRMQIDLQQPLRITRVLFDKAELPCDREGDAWFITFANPLTAAQDHEVTVFYEGKPVESVNPPWQGGVTWTTDERGFPYVATSCQGIGASTWWPNKDHGYDEPDRGANIRITVPDSLSAVSNGRLTRTNHDTNEKTKTFHWQVKNPINNYNINLNVGRYVSFSEQYVGEFGTLDLQHWVLDHQRQRAMQHFREAPRVLAAFEHWFGKYPFYEDSYKLVATPYVGMEHQSSIAYGNGFRNGYRGKDISGTGVGLKFDFIIVHESGHEWFGNNVSMKDAADMWIHESFTNYSECLFVEYHFGKQDAEDYVVGIRQNILNDRPIIGTYDRNQTGSRDMYYKGANMLHTLRQFVDNDQKWQAIMRSINQTFWHQTVDSQQIESYLAEQTGLKLKPFFDQYLRTIRIPKFVFRIDGRELGYHYQNTVDGFAYPLRIKINGQAVRLTPTDQPRSLTWSADIRSCEVDRNFYVESEEEK